MDKQKLSRKKIFGKIFTIVSAFAAGRLLESSIMAAEKLSPRKTRKVKTDCDLAEVTGNDPAEITRQSVKMLGGMGRFVKKGDIVVVKPNIGWNRTPEYAANTNPEVVAALVKMALAAGAKKVRVFDNTCNSAKMCYANSGIADAARKAGAEIIYPASWKYVAASFPKGSAMDDWLINRDAVECDCFINVPIAKHHGLTGLTLSIKNLMGVCGGTRGMMHWNIDKKLAELGNFIKPDLTIIDAYRVLLRNGPSGGNLEDVLLTRTVLASADAVLADTRGAELMKRVPAEIKHIPLASKMGLGSMNTAAANIKKAALKK